MSLMSTYISVAEHLPLPNVVVHTTVSACARDAGYLSEVAIVAVEMLEHLMNWRELLKRLH